MKKRKKSKNIGLILVVVLLLVVFFIYYKFVYLGNFIPHLEVMENRAFVKNYYIYGTSLSIEGVVNDIDTSYEDIDLVLYNGDFYDYDIEIIRGESDVKFSLGSDINVGLSLEEIEVGKYYLFLRVCYKNDDEECDYDYYVLENETGYEESIYYTMSNTGYKVYINSFNDYETLMFNVDLNNDDEIYDVVIDPGHGGVDVGAISSDSKYTEASITMKISRYIYKRLSSKGIKVKLTREEDSFTSNDYFEEYNIEGIGYIGRAVIPRSVGAKYVFSIHLNSLSDSNKTRGVEVYTADSIDYGFAESLINDIVEKTEMVVSSKETYRVSDGIYTHNFTDSEVSSALVGYDKKGYERYEVSTNSNYLYMIRETGGIMTGAYVDGRNKKIGKNPYYDSNIGVEAYLIELGYLSNNKDLNYIINNIEEYANVIADAISREVFGV